MARNPKPVALQLLQGNAGKKSKAELERLQQADESLKFESDDIKPPAWLDTVGKKTFRQLVLDFVNTGLLVNVDTYALSMFSDAYSDYVKFTRIINKEGLQIEHTNKAGETNKVPHPLITKKAQAFTQMDRMMSKFGLSPVDRAKLIQNMQPEEKDDAEENPFAGRL